MLEKRAKVVAELVQTEKDYIRDLEMCIERVMVPLQQAQVGDECWDWSTVPSTAVLQLQAEWLSGEGIKTQHKGQTYQGTVSGFSLWLVGSVASKPVAKQRIIMQRLCSRTKLLPSGTQEAGA